MVTEAPFSASGTWSDQEYSVSLESSLYDLLRPPGGESLRLSIQDENSVLHGEAHMKFRDFFSQTGASKQSVSTNAAVWYFDPDVAEDTVWADATSP